MRYNSLWRRGFTLIELLVVIAVIALLAGLLLPALQRARLQAHRIACAGQMRQIHLGLSSYANDSNGWFPLSNWATQALIGMDSGDDMAGPGSYIGSPKILRCPDSQGVLDDTTCAPSTLWGKLRITSYRFTACRSNYSSGISYIYGVIATTYSATRNDNRISPCVPRDTFAGTVQKDPFCGLTVYIHPPESMPALIDGCVGGTSSPETWVPYALGAPWTTNHRRLNGINVVFLDGHSLWSVQVASVPQRIRLYSTYELRW